MLRRTSCNPKRGTSPSAGPESNRAANDSMLAGLPTRHPRLSPCAKTGYTTRTPSCRQLRVHCAKYNQSQETPHERMWFHKKMQKLQRQQPTLHSRLAQIRLTDNHAASEVPAPNERWCDITGFTRANRCPTPGDSLSVHGTLSSSTRCPRGNHECAALQMATDNTAHGADSNTHRHL